MYHITIKIKEKEVPKLDAGRFLQVHHSGVDL
jgi:hypothetical protein